MFFIRIVCCVEVLVRVVLALAIVVMAVVPVRAEDDAGRPPVVSVQEAGWMSSRDVVAAQAWGYGSGAWAYPPSWGSRPYPPARYGSYRYRGGPQAGYGSPYARYPTYRRYWSPPYAGPYLNRRYPYTAPYGWRTLTRPTTSTLPPRPYDRAVDLRQLRTMPWRDRPIAQQ
jgi:hypothetical protein